MARMKKSVVLLALLMTTLFASAAFAQFDTATVVGTVRDDSNAVVPGATITLTNLDTGIAITRVTDSNGSYEFVTVRPGRYQITAELQGFSTATAEDVQVAVAARQRVELQLKPGNLTETVEVVGAATGLETDSSQRGQVITS
jgi:type 1 fimbria pilin